ncbi:MAG: glycosyltransferase family 1 protein [Patescibacteria group bacterium]|jgi:glycosyltransferase involved in cell wall biosynthesis
MKIGIDANWLIYEQAGIGRYSYYLIRELLRQDKENEYILFANFVKNYEQRKKILEDLISQSRNKKTEIYISRIPSAWRDYLTQTAIPLNLIYPKKIDLYFSTYFSGIAKNGFSKQAVVLYDMVFAKYPEHAGQKLSDYYYKRTKQAIGNSDIIFAISESTRNDLLDSFSLKKNDIDIIYPGVDMDFFSPRSDSKIVEKYKIDSPYILSVCTLEPRKNLELLLDSYNILPDDLKRKYKIVLAGGSGWNNSKLMQKIEEMTDRKQIIRTGYVPDNDLPYLYSNATVFAYPSLYEGFGMPPLEAMACGCPVLTSNVSSLPEVIGQAGIMFNPLDKNELTQKISNILSDDKKLKKMSVDGLNQSKKFTWQNSAQKLISYFINNR